MRSSLKIKKKLLGKTTSDTCLGKAIKNSQQFLQSTRVDSDFPDYSKELFESIKSPQKGYRNLNLHLPSTDSQCFSAGLKAKAGSPKSVKSPRVNSLKKKIYSDLAKSPAEDCDLHLSEKALFNASEKARYLEIELLKAFSENKRLKKEMSPAKVPEDYIEDLMQNFKNRVVKILYNG